MSINYNLTQSQNGKRVRLEVAGIDPVWVMVGDPSEGWTEGAFIEVVRISPDAVVQFEPFDGSITLNILSGTNILQDGEYGRVSYVSPGVWDLHIYKAAKPELLMSELSDVADFGASVDSVLIYDGKEWVPTYDPFPRRSSPIKPTPLYIETTSSALAFIGSALQHNTHYRFTSPTDITVIVQPDSFWTGTQEYWEDNYSPSDPGPMPGGGSVMFTKRGTGNVTFTPGVGVIINTPDTFTISKLNGRATLIKAGPNEWDLAGDVAP